MPKSVSFRSNTCFRSNKSLRSNQFCLKLEIDTKFQWNFREISWNSDNCLSMYVRTTAKLMKNPNFCKICVEKIIKQVDEDVLNCWDVSGAKECTSCRSRTMLNNEHLLATIGVDIAENGPNVKVWSSELLVLLILSPRNAGARFRPRSIVAPCLRCPRSPWIGRSWRQP